MLRIDHGQRWSALVCAGALVWVGCGSDDDAGRGAGYDAGGRLLLDGGGGGGGWSDASGWGGSDGGVGVPDSEEHPPDEEGPADAGPELPDGGDLCALRDSMEPYTLYMSADDSNSMASPVLARRMIRAGGLPDPGVVRTYEFLNYYNVAYPAPEAGHVNVVPELRETGEPGELELQIGVQAAPPPEQPKDRVVTLVLDTSGSMSGEPMDNLKEVARSIASILNADDIVSMVEWNTERTVPLESHRVSGPDDPTLLAAIDALEASGGTNLDAGLEHGYELATTHYDARKLNRVVLISDGHANVGETSAETIALNAEDAESAGIYLVGVAVGERVGERLMDVVTDLGRGAYVYIDSADEARHMFTTRFDEVMEVGLLDVRLELTLPWYMAIRQFHGEEVSEVAKEVTPQHLAPGDAMVFNQTLGACDPELLDTSDVIQARATYVRPDGYMADSDGHEATMAELLEQADVGLARGRAIVAFAEALKTAYGAGRYSEEGQAAFAEAQRLVDEADPAGTDPALSEIEELLGLLLVPSS